MNDFSNKKILLGVCGGVAAYKSAFLLRELTRLGAEVRVVMTRSASQFVSPLLMQSLCGHEVRTEVFDTQAERAMGHIELARWAELIVIAPATANTLAKIAQGIADDLLSTLYLVAELPVLVCPAMNRSMWAHPATAANCQLLRDRGVIFIGPDEGVQACGDQGLGRMSEVEEIIDALRLHEVHQLLVGQKILITAGPTHEVIDPVRYLSNYSSGKMGFALAKAATMAGAEVILVSGPTALRAPSGLRLIRVHSAQEMLSAVMDHLQEGTVFIGAAAVADYQVDLPASEKLKKQDQKELLLKLHRTADILSAVVDSGKARSVVGFAAETTDVIAYATEKLERKRLDFIVANQVGKGLGFESDENQVSIITKKNRINLPLTNKVRLAGQIIAILAITLQNVAHKIDEEQ